MKIKLNKTALLIYPLSYRFLLFTEDKSVLLNDILSMNKQYVTVTAKFQF
jgi:hypothetical protein